MDYVYINKYHTTYKFFLFVLFFVLFMFSTRRRHTICALVTVVQTCALPIWQIGIEPLPDRDKRRMREIAVQAAPYARLECEVAGLSVALPQPGKDAEDLGVALRAKHFIGRAKGVGVGHARRCDIAPDHRFLQFGRSEEHTSELQSLMRISYAVFCLKKKTTPPSTH